MATKGVVSILIQAKDDATKALRLVTGATEALAKSEKTAAASTRELSAAEKNLAEAQKVGFKSVKELLAALDSKTTKLKAGAQATQQEAAATAASARASTQHSRAVQNEVNQLRGLGIQAQRVAEQETRLLALRTRLAGTARTGAVAQQQAVIVTQNLGRAATGAAPGVGKLQNAAQQLAFGLSGIPGAAGRVISTLATFTLGGGWTLGIVAGISAIVAVWDRLTGAQREAKRTAEELTVSLVKAAKARTGQDIAEERAGKVAEIVAAQARLRRLLQGEERGGQLTGRAVVDAAAVAKARKEIQELAVALGELDQRAAEFRGKKDPVTDEIELIGKRVEANKATASDLARLTTLEASLNAQLAAGNLTLTAENAILDKLAGIRGIHATLAEREKQAIEAANTARDRELQLLRARAQQSALTGADLRRLKTLETELTAALEKKNLADAEQLRLRGQLAAVQGVTAADPRLAALGLDRQEGTVLSRTERPVPVIVVGTKEAPAGRKAGTGPDLRGEPEIITDIRTGLTGALQDFLSRGLTTFETLGQAVANFGRSVIQVFLDIFAKIAAKKAVEGFLDFIKKGLTAAATGGAGAAEGGVITTKAGKPVLLAGGGMVRGPGTSTSDSIPALLSNGEGVLKASTVDILGGPQAIAALNTMDLSGLAALNTMNWGLLHQRSRVPRFADGGVAGAALGTSGSAGIPTRVSVEASSDLVVRQIENGPAGRAVISVIGKNKRQIRAALGING